MNLTKLFEKQKELGRVGLFNYRGEDRFNKLVLALLVELGECANEWRGFKFWSKDQEPRTEVFIPCESCGGSGKNYSGYCGSCHGGYIGKANPLLEEYVDGLHFVLELGIELNLNYSNASPSTTESITKQFNKIAYHTANILQWENSDMRGMEFYIVLRCYIGLGEMLGFTWGQIEQAYFEKNKINHERQEQGY